MLSESHPLIRMVLRFLALPYYYLKHINWEECTASKMQVIKDLLYIFFKLRYYPYNYSLCRLWSKSRREWSYYYGSIYDPYQRAKLRKEVHPKKFGIVYQDKSICYCLCAANNIPVPKQFGVIDINEDYKEFIKSIFRNNNVKRLILKPADGGGGKGIVLIEKRDDGFYVRKRNSELPMDAWKLASRCVVQEYINQDKALSRVSKSINTVRIVTMLKKNGKVIIVGALMRFGVGESFLDNTSQGGVAVGINIQSGRLKPIANDFDSRQYSHHPTSHIKFEGFKVPQWNEVVKLAKKVQRTLAYCKLLGQDIAISSNGPLVIELNDDYDNVGLEQSYGPILMDKEVWKAFREYDLFINRYQACLY